MSSKRSRAANPDCPARDCRWAVLLFVASLASVLSLDAAAHDGAGQSSPDIDAVQRARSSVLKVECHDHAPGGTPSVLSAVALDDDGYIVTVGLRSPGNCTLVVKDCGGKAHE